MSSFKCTLVETFWTLGLKKELTANTNSVTVIYQNITLQLSQDQKKN